MRKEYLTKIKISIQGENIIFYCLVYSLFIIIKVRYLIFTRKNKKSEGMRKTEVESKGEKPKKWVNPTIQVAYIYSNLSGGLMIFVLKRRRRR